METLHVEPNKSFLDYPQPEEFAFTYDDLLAYLKRKRNKSFYLTLGQSAPNAHNGGETRYRVSANVEVSRVAMLRYLNNAFYPAMRERVKIEVHEYETCIFVGSSL